MSANILDGIVIGAVGGAAAGIVVYMVRFIHLKFIDFIEFSRVYRWLGSHTTLEPGKEFRSTRTIASWNNITEDRTRYICSTHKKIYLSTGRQEEMWGLHIMQFPRKDFKNDT